MNGYMNERGIISQDSQMKNKEKGLLEKEETKRIKISHSVCLYYQITQTFDSYTNYSPAMEHTGLLPNDP